MIEHRLPEHDKGWLLIDEHKARVHASQQCNFVASVRDYEGAFTSGLISEEVYRSNLEVEVMIHDLLASGASREQADTWVARLRLSEIGKRQNVGKTQDSAPVNSDQKSDKGN